MSSNLTLPDVLAESGPLIGRTTDSNPLVEYTTEGAERGYTKVKVKLTEENHAISNLPFVRGRQVADFFEFQVGSQDLSSLLKTTEVGWATFIKMAQRICLKSVSTPANILFVSNNQVTLPSNLESAADSLAVSLMVIYGRLGIEMKVGDSTIAIPGSFSAGWQTNFGALSDYLVRLCGDLRKSDRPHMQTRSSLPVVQRVVSVLLFKWANARGMAKYLLKEHRKNGNISEIEFIDFARTWGQDATGNICQRILAATYQVIGLIALRSEFDDMIPVSAFETGTSIKNSLEPARQVVERKGKQQNLAVVGRINVAKFDTIRFLIPSERSSIRCLNRSAELDLLVKSFDQKPIKERNYPHLENCIKEILDETSKIYFSVRRSARSRLYAIKEVRREARQPEIIQDSEFANNDFVESVIKQANGIAVDVNRKNSLIERLSVNVLNVSSSLPRGEEETS